MKLIKDFGVRALIALVSGLGGYGALIYVLVSKDLDTATIVAIVGLALAPFSAAIGFYFGERKGRNNAE